MEANQNEKYVPKIFETKETNEDYAEFREAFKKFAEKYEKYITGFSIHHIHKTWLLNISMSSEPINAK